MLGIAALILLLGVTVYWFLQNPIDAEVGKVKLGRITLAVYGTVSVEPKVKTTIRSQASGAITQLNIEKGDIIVKGHPIAEINDDNARMRLQEAKNALEKAKRGLQIGPAEKAEMERQKQQVEITRKLVNEGLISPVKLQDEESKFKSLKDLVDAQQLELESAIREAQALYTDAEIMTTQTRIIAPQNGVVLDVFAQIGEVVVSQTPLCLIGSASTQINARIKEDDVGGLKPGMKAIVKLYPFPNQDFTGTLLEVLPWGDRQEYSVLFQLDSPPENLLPGMSGEINIILDTRDNALIVPTRAVRDKRQLYVVDNSGRVRIREVRLGYFSLEQSQILDGVIEGEKVILSDHFKFSEGKRVNPILKD